MLSHLYVGGPGQVTVLPSVGVFPPKIETVMPTCLHAVRHSGKGLEGKEGRPEGRWYGGVTCWESRRAVLL